MKELTSMWNLEVLRSLVDDFIYNGNEGKCHLQLLEKNSLGSHKTNVP